MHVHYIMYNYRVASVWQCISNGEAFQEREYLPRQLQHHREVLAETRGQLVGLCLDWMDAFMVLVAMLGIGVTRTVSTSDIDAGFAGLALTNLGGLTFILSSLSSNAAETETRVSELFPSRLCAY